MPSDHRPPSFLHLRETWADMPSIVRWSVIIGALTYVLIALVA